MRDAQTEPRLTTKDQEYSDRLRGEEAIWWKKTLDVQKPYRWNLRRIKPGFTLDIGCGLGRNLINLSGHGVGIDHNPYSIEIAQSRGIRAFTPDQFRDSQFNAQGQFDSILLSHVAEHMTEQEVIRLLIDHLYLLKPRGRIILITPQECGYRADPTHVQFMDFDRLRNIAREAGLVFLKEYSFPLPRLFGRLFKYNEFVCISRKQG